MSGGKTIQEKQELSEVQLFDVMKTSSDFQIEPYDSTVDLEDTSRFTKLSLSSGQKMQVSAFLHQTPQALAAVLLAKAYKVSFPKGCLMHSLL